jgi:hypothetical protein
LAKRTTSAFWVKTVVEMLDELVFGAGVRRHRRT